MPDRPPIRLVRLALLAWAFLLSVPAAAQSGPLKPEVAGWAAADPPRLFTAADLYGYINGGAELFLEFGFEYLAVQTWRNGPAELSVEAYRMLDPTAAVGVYVMKCGRERPDPSFAGRHTLGRYQLQFHKGPWYVVIANPAGDESQGADMLAFARSLADAIPPASPPALWAELPRQGRRDDTLRVIRGPYALQAVYTLGDGDILSLQGGALAVSAVYGADHPLGAHTLILALYGSEAAATEAFTFLNRHLDPYLTPLTRSAGRLTFRDYAAKHGRVERDGRRIRVWVNLAHP